jgi:hypothetical protein
VYLCIGGMPEHLSGKMPALGPHLHDTRPDRSVMGELEALVDLLGRERTLLEVLVYRLVQLRSLLVTSGRMDGRFLAWAAEEVEDATAAVRGAELHRAMLISRIAEEQQRLDESLTLATLVDIADPPWRALLAEHRAALCVLTAEVDDHASAVRRLARTRTDPVGALLAHVGAAQSVRA